MNAAEKLVLPDIQSTADHRRIAIQQVGVVSIVHPVAVRTATGVQSSMTTIDMAMSLSAHPRVTRYHVSSKNVESIHTHSAYAVVEGTSP